MQNTISFDVNNQIILRFTQDAHDSEVVVSKLVPTIDPDYPGYKTVDPDTVIPAGDFVMLYNLYVYIKRNNIQNDFINPYGKNKE